MNEHLGDLPLQEFLEQFHWQHLAVLSRDFMQVELRTFAKSLGHEPRLSDLSIASISAAQDYQLARGRSHATASKVRQALLALWHKAWRLDERGELQLNIRRPPVPGSLPGLTKIKRKPEAWTIGEFERILSAALALEGSVGPHEKSIWFSALLWLDYNSGLRISAAMATRWEWLHLERGLLRVPPEHQKDDEGTDITLLAETIAALGRLALVAGKKGEVFAHWPYDRTCVQWPALNLELKKCLVSARLIESTKSDTRRLLWHMIRRTFATALYEECRDIEAVRDMLGHSDVAVTWTYIDKTLISRKSQADLLPVPKPSPLRIYRPPTSGAG